MLGKTELYIESECASYFHTVYPECVDRWKDYFPGLSRMPDLCSAKHMLCLSQINRAQYDDVLYQGIVCQCMVGWLVGRTGINRSV